MKHVAGKRKQPEAETMFTLPDNRMAVVTVPDDMTKKEWNRIARSILAQIKERKRNDKLSKRRSACRIDSGTPGLEQLPDAIRGL